jgi:hypothetical protein
MAKSKIYTIYVCKMYNMYTMNESMVGNKEYILEEELGRHLWSCIQNANHGNHPDAINHYCIIVFTTSDHVGHFLFDN